MQLAIENEPDQVAAAIRNFLAGNDELIDIDPAPLTHDLAGHCYVASEAYYHLNGGQENWTPQHVEVVWEQGANTTCRTPHWFLKHRHEPRVVDLTAEQFASMGVEYKPERATGRGFVPPTPSSRAEKVIEAVR
jgi:hypothetical protein